MTFSRESEQEVGGRMICHAGAAKARGNDICEVNQPGNKDVSGGKDLCNHHVLRRVNKGFLNPKSECPLSAPMHCNQLKTRGVINKDMRIVLY